jgi:hypothetical protein
MCTPQTDIVQYTGKSSLSITCVKHFKNDHDCGDCQSESYTITWETGEFLGMHVRYFESDGPTVVSTERTDFCDDIHAVFATGAVQSNGVEPKFVSFLGMTNLNNHN